MSTPARMPLKLKLSTSGASSQPSPQPQSTPSSGAPKIKLKFGSSSARPSISSEAGGAGSSSPLVATKEAKKRKLKEPADPNGSALKSRKRVKADAEHDERDGVASSAAGGSATKPPIKKLKLTNRTPVTPIIRTKFKGKPPPRPLGVGYDSESSDREIDPAIEEEFILRMAPGEDCDYLRRAIEEKRLGLPLKDGGADVRMKFLNREGRRALLTIRGRHYAATMVDLPCVIEGMKSWDKRGWWKSADICQMLLVIGRVEDEKAASTAPLPPQIDQKTWQYPHGLTPPMHYVRKRRFRKRVSNRTIEAVEDEVERLLALDAQCAPGASRYDVVDLDRLTREQSTDHSDLDAEADEDDEGGYDMLGEAGMQQSYGMGDEVDVEEGGDLEADLEMALMMEEEQAQAAGADGTSVSTTAATATATVPAGTVPPPPTAATLGAKNASGDLTLDTMSEVAAEADLDAEADAEGEGEVDGEADADEDEDDEDDDDDDDNQGEEMDEDQLEQQQDLLRQKEEIADLEAAIKKQTAELERLTNPILRQKLSKKIQSLRSDLELKVKAIGGGDDDDDQ